MSTKAKREGWAASFITGSESVVEFTTEISDGRGKDADSVVATFQVDFSGITPQQAILGMCAASSIPVVIRGTLKRAYEKETFADLKAWAEKFATRENPFRIRYKSVGHMDAYEDPALRERKDAENFQALEESTRQKLVLQALREKGFAREDAEAMFAPELIEAVYGGKSESES